VPVFAELAGVPEADVMRDLPGAALGQVSVDGWKAWLAGRGWLVEQLDGCPADRVPCAHLVANCPQTLEDFHWVYRDENGDVHDPGSVSLILPADHPHMRELMAYDTHQLTIIVKRAIATSKLA
jgi:hypothetical protein